MVDPDYNQPCHWRLGLGTAFRPGAIHSQTSGTDIRRPDRLDPDQGAALAGGCVVGNIMSGVALASAGMILFTIVVILANWATTYFYLMAGSLRSNE